MAPILGELQNGVISSPPPNTHNTHSLALQHSNLLAGGHVILSEVPDNVTATTAAPLSDSGCFLGFISDEPKSRHVTSLGKLKNIRFMSIFRFKVWWTTHWTGRNGRDLEYETQILLLENSADGRPYVVIIPIIDGSFRGSIQPGPEDNVDLCVESGSTKVTGSSFTHVLYVESGSDPFKLVRDSIRVVRMHLGTFKLLEEKNPPGIVDTFGWCTWDAFYLKVHPEGIWEGVNDLVNGGCPPGFVLIDDGWQSIARDEDDPYVEGMNYTSAGEQMPCRLIKFEENYKFRNYQSRRIGEDRGMGAFVKDMKEEFKTLEFVYVWHALCGYWGGLRPGMRGLPECEVITPMLSPGLQTTMEDLAVDKIVNYGVGLPRPELAGQMYEALHSHLESVGIDGVKVDVIHLLETLAEDYGGRVELAKAYYKALTSSVKKHFKGNGVIASMEHCNDFMLLGTEAVCLGRVGDDFWCTDPSGDPTGTFWLQGCHMVHCAYNSLWMGNFIHPDWDMFQSTHPCADFHAASRAISGGPVYVSDAVGKHDFALLKRLVLPDGSILRCVNYALPTKDCLFEDPLHDGKTLLKIWNLNTFAGVVGGFNCQGGGWCRETRRNQCASDSSRTVSARVSPGDIEWKSQHLHPAAEFAVYFFRAKKLVVLKLSEGVELSLEPFEFELLTVSPVTSAGDVRFAPVGLVNMLNSGGAVQSCLFDDEEKRLKVDVRGTGDMRVFTTRKPRACRVRGKDAEFIYEHDMVAVHVPWDHAANTSAVEYFF